VNPKRIDTRLRTFSCAVIRLLDELPRGLFCQENRSQLLKSATSIGANYEEATAAESRADFIHKMQVALKEARETCYWLDILATLRTELETVVGPIQKESHEIRAILIAAVKTAKANTMTRRTASNGSAEA
jgi:four helix bundle protein